VLDSLVEVGIQVGMTGLDTVVAVHMKAGRMHLVDQSMLVVEDKAVSKILQVVHKVLEKMIHNPHLV